MKEGGKRTSRQQKKGKEDEEGKKEFFLRHERKLAGTGYMETVPSVSMFTAKFTPGGTKL